MTVSITIRKGNQAATFAASSPQLAAEVGRGYTKLGYFVTITCKPN